MPENKKEARFVSEEKNKPSPKTPPNFRGRV